MILKGFIIIQDDEEDDDFDETLSERLIGLTEMFPQVNNKLTSTRKVKEVE